MNDFQESLKDIRGFKGTEKINKWSFFSALICILLYFIVPSISGGDHAILGLHPFTIVLCITSVTFFFGLLGFSGVTDRQGMLRSVTTIIITLGLSVFLMFILLVGKLLE
ncbi:hypothetical protein ACQKII_02605 [Lysinibacillus sp. NPDC048646]|uniref:hypothetical protein n=1 Tax=Lysinibacillus sp. NPDC048646 TaxID=3390574 RepID=UPI003D073939